MTIIYAIRHICFVSISVKNSAHSAVTGFFIFQSLSFLFRRKASEPIKSQNKLASGLPSRDSAWLGNQRLGASEGSQGIGTRICFHASCRVTAVGPCCSHLGCCSLQLRPFSSGRASPPQETLIRQRVHHSQLHRSTSRCLCFGKVSKQSS